MKWFTVLIFTLCLTVKVLPQSDDIGFKCGFVSDTSSFSNNTPVTIPQNLRITVLLCAEPGSNDVVSVEQFMNEFKSKFNTYFRIATNNKRNISISEILVNHISGDTAHVLKLAGNLAYDPIVGQPDFVLSPALTNQLLAKADSLYDFSQFDADNDGIVDFLAIMIIRHTSLHNGGTIGLSTNAFYETNDYSVNGSRIRIDGTQYSRAIIQKLNCPSNYSTKLLSLTIHELGHSLFGFGDTDHSGEDYFNHYALGGFCAMSDGQFRNVASIYNPIIRLQKGYASATQIYNTQTITLKSFEEDTSRMLYYYSLPSRYAFSNTGQKVYMAYFEKNPNNYFTSNWPLPLMSNGKYGGVLLYKTNDLGQWHFRENMPIQILSAHGKWQWAIDDTSEMSRIGDERSVRTNIEDPVEGLDSLQVRFSYLWYKAVLINNILQYRTPEPLYENGQFYKIGSESCFFIPEQNKEFAFYTNPSSNSTIYRGVGRFSQNQGSDFKIQRFYHTNDGINVDVKVGKDANIITKNTTLFKGSYYIYNDVTIPADVTLQVQAGTIFNISPNASIKVYGTLNINGTKNDSIILAKTYNQGNNLITVFPGGKLNISNACLSNADTAVILKHNSQSNISNIFIKNTLNQVIGLFSEGATMSLSHLTTQNCDSALVISGSSIIASDLHIAASEKCRISGNTLFLNGASLVIDGILNFNGTLNFSAPVESLYNGVKLRNGSNVNISGNTSIDNAFIGLFLEPGAVYPSGNIQFNCCHIDSGRRAFEAMTNWTGNLIVLEDITIIDPTLLDNCCANIFCLNGTSLSFQECWGGNLSGIIIDFISPNYESCNGVKFLGEFSINQGFTIKNAYIGIYTESVPLALIGTNVLNCHIGIYPNISGPIQAFIDNYLDNNGLGFYGRGSLAVADFNNNRFINNGMGLEIGQSAYVSGYGNIFEDQVCIQMWDHSMVDFHSCSFRGDGDYLYTWDHCDAYFANNYWNGCNPTQYYDKVDNSTSGDFVVLPYYQYDINSRMVSNDTETLSVQTIDDDINPLTLNKAQPAPLFDINWPVKKQLYYLLNLHKNLNFDEIKKNVKIMMHMIPDSPFSGLLLTFLRSAYRNNQDSLKTILSEIALAKNKHHINGAAELMLASIDKNNKIIHLNNVLNNYSADSLLCQQALSSKFLHYLISKKDRMNAFEVLKTMRTNYPGNRSTEIAGFIYGDSTHPIMKDVMKSSGSPEKTISAINGLPDEYMLLGNYPNPFNPETTIKYTLPCPSYIEISIYDIMGKEIRNFRISNQPAGYKEIKWDGKNSAGEIVSSGIYIYSFRALPTEANKKSYVKTGKMIMMK